MSEKDTRGRKTLLVVAEKCPAAVRELYNIRGDATFISEALDVYTGSDAALKLMKKKRASLVISVAGLESLVLGRKYNNEFVDLVKFRINKMQSSSNFSSVPAHLFAKYAVVIQNVSNPRLENLIVDTFSQRTREICLDALNYAWIFAGVGSSYVLKYVRVRPDFSIEDVGPFFDISVEKEYFCDDEIWEKALDQKRIRKRKNVSQTALHETVGRVYVDKQDLRDVTLRKTKANRRQKIRPARAE